MATKRKPVQRLPIEAPLAPPSSLTELAGMIVNKRSAGKDWGNAPSDFQGTGSFVGGTTVRGGWDKARKRNAP